jgi:acyl-CoA reductase-like NAD-dependent aldehyde dehydrogenase
MMKFHALVRDNAQELAELIVKENGKNITEALADGKSLCHFVPLLKIHCPHKSLSSSSY